MPKPNKNPDEQEIQANILAEEQDMEDELEEDVGAIPRKVTMKEFVEAEKAFNDLIDSEEIEFETMPFQPGNTKFVLTKRQRNALTGGVEELDKYFKREDSLSMAKEDNKQLKALHEAMKTILADGLDGLSEEQRNTAAKFNEIMNGAYNHDTKEIKTLIKHIWNFAGPYELDLSDLHTGLDMLGVMIGVPATYQGNTSADRLDIRTEKREGLAKRMAFEHPEEVTELLTNAEIAGLNDLRDKFAGTEIGEKLEQIKVIANDLKRNQSGDNSAKYDFEDHLKAADGLGTFLNTKGKNGKTNYDTIAETLLGKKQSTEQKKAFDMLLGQLNTVCSLDISVPYAIEAQEEYQWKKDQKKEADKERISAANAKLFGEDGKVHAWDKEFLSSVDFLADAIDALKKAKLDLNTENYTRMFGAANGLRELSATVRTNSAFEKLDVDNQQYVDALNLGKTLHRKQGDKTLYELLAETYEARGSSREDLNKTLTEMNDRLDMKIVIPGVKIDGQEAKPVIVEQLDPYTRKIKEVQRSAHRMQDPVSLKLALASILALRRMSVDPAHKGHTKIRTKAAQAKTIALKDTEAFKTLTKDMDILALRKKIEHPGNFDKDFISQLKKLDEAKYRDHLKNKDLRAKLASTATNAAEKMKQTGTGEYLLGVKRGSNSGMYDRAVLAMQRAGKKQDPATVMQSVQTVKEYLSNKMPPRKSPSGRERWKDCMEFLHAAMPEKEFEEYCNQINSARKAKVGSSNYIKPSDFIVQRNSVPAEPEKNKEELGTEAESSGRNSI